MLILWLLGDWNNPRTMDCISGQTTSRALAGIWPEWQSVLLWDPKPLFLNISILGMPRQAVGTHGFWICEIFINEPATAPWIASLARSLAVLQQVAGQCSCGVPLDVFVAFWYSASWVRLVTPGDADFGIFASMDQPLDHGLHLWPACCQWQCYSYY